MLFVYYSRKLATLIDLLVTGTEFLFYSLMNVDVLPIATIVLSYYCFSREKYSLSASWLALVPDKVFPVFLFSSLFLCYAKRETFELTSLCL